MDPFSLYNVAHSLEDSFKSALLSGVCSVDALDKLLSLCLWLIPESYGTNEVAARGFQAILGIIRIGYDGMIQSRMDRLTSSFTWATAMNLIRQIEVVYEVKAKHLAQRGKCDLYGYMAGLELLKLFVRLCHLKATGCTVTTCATTAATAGVDLPDHRLQGGRNPDHVLEAMRTLSEMKQFRIPSSWESAGEEQVASDDDSSTGTHWMDERAPENGEENDDDFKPWWEKLNRRITLRPEDRSPPSQCSSSLKYRLRQSMLLIGELLYLIRPMACVLALRKFGSCSWKPWLMSLGMDVCSRALLSKGESIVKYYGVNCSKELSIQDQLLSYLQMARNLQWTPVEKKEMKRRRTLFLIYLLRSPLFETMTKPGLDSMQRVASSFPFLGQAIAKALEVIYGVQRYYVYTSGRW